MSNEIKGFFVPEIISYSYNELKEKIGVSFTLKEINKYKRDINDSFNHRDYIKDIAYKLASTEVTIDEAVKIKEEIIERNENIHKKHYIVQEVFANTKEQNDSLPKNHDEDCKTVFGYGYNRFHDDDEELKRSFLSLKINDNELSEGINSFINEINNRFYHYYNIDLYKYDPKKIINIILKPKSLKHKISIAQMLISELKKISKDYLERSVDSTIEDIKTVYLKDISTSFNTYEIPEIVDNKVYLVDKNTFAIKEVSVSLHFYLSILKLNEISKGNFFTDFYLLSKDNKKVAYYEIDGSNKLNIYNYNNYIFFRKEDAKIFSKEKLNKLIAYSNKVKDINDNF